MIVVDTNILAYFWLPGEYTESVNSLYKNDSEWIAPFLWRSEFRSILTLYIRKKLLTTKDAIEIIGHAQAMMKGKEYSIDSLEVLDKVKKCSLSAYDLEYIILAESLDLKLFTLDKKVLKEFPDIAITPVDYLKTK